MKLRDQARHLVVVAILAAPGPALAAAWTQEARHGEAIVTATASRAEEAFDTSRSLSPTPRYQKIVVQTLLEYGVTDRLTVILSPGLQHIEIGTGATARSGNPQFIEVGGRYRLARGDNWVVAGQTTMRWSGRTSSANAAPVDNTGNEIDLRALAGYGFTLMRWPAFLDAQLSHRFRSGGSPNEIHADMTLGMRPAPKWLVLAQSFNVVSEGAGDPGFPSYDYLKFQASAVYQLTRRLGLQAGAFTTYMGRHSIQENGLVLGAWYQF